MDSLLKKAARKLAASEIPDMILFYAEVMKLKALESKKRDAINKKKLLSFSRPFLKTAGVKITETDKQRF